MQKVAVIGAGISGLSTAVLLKERYFVTIFEKSSEPGGLLKCRYVNGSLFHTCGGHVFNSNRQEVLDWFWGIFNREKDFIRADRNSVISMDDGAFIPYPIENHIYCLPYDVQKSCIADFLDSANSQVPLVDNFEDYLIKQFGKTLYNLYFKPYNEKVWRRELKTVPLAWLEGKLPMPNIEDIFLNNINHIKEKTFVHSSFWYEKVKGSQFIVDTLARGLNIKYSSPVEKMVYNSRNNKWIIHNEQFDIVVYCGNIKDMIHMIIGIDVNKYIDEVDALDYHGTTAVFCEIDKNPYSWIYQPSSKHSSHRIICTGNFSESNNDASLPKDRITATIEFTDEISLGDIYENLKRIPYNPKYICHEYNKYSYPIQNCKTREMIMNMKCEFMSKGLYFTGRFADWEYYNMDVAISAAMDLCKLI